MAFCTKCGAQVDEGVKFCPSCGNQLGQAAQPQQQYQQPQYQQPQYQQPQYQQYQQVAVVSSKSRLVAFLLCTFLGVIGVHRFYVGKVGTGIVWILTLGCFGIGVLIDWIMLLCGSFTDQAGLPVKNWDAN